MGTPTKSEWPDGYRLADRRGYTFPKIKGKGLKRLITNASSDAINFMLATLQYDPKSRPTASELLRHPFFKNHKISSDIYAHAKGKNLKNLELKKRGSELESLKISPSGITIEKDDVDNSPFNMNKLKAATGIISGFDLRKSDSKVPKLVHRPSYELEPRHELQRKSMIDRSAVQQSVLFKNSDEYKPAYYKTEDRKYDMDEFKSRVKDPVFPYYKSNNNDPIGALNVSPGLQLDRKLYNKSDLDRIVEKKPLRLEKSKIDLANPALITSDSKIAAKKNKKYELDFTARRRGEEKQIYKPSDKYEKRVLNIQQSLPELIPRKQDHSGLDR